MERTKKIGNSTYCYTNKYPHLEENSKLPITQHPGSQVARRKLGRGTKLVIPNKSRTNSSRSISPASKIRVSRILGKGNLSIHLRCGIASCKGVGRRDRGRERYPAGDLSSSAASRQSVPCIKPCSTRAEKMGHDGQQRNTWSVVIPSIGCRIEWSCCGSSSESTVWSSRD